MANKTIHIKLLLILGKKFFYFRYEGLEDHGTSRLTQSSGNYDKLANDINMIVIILRQGKKQFIQEKNLKAIKKCTMALKKIMEDDHQLIKDMEHNEQLIGQLSKLREDEKSDSMKKIEEINKDIQKLRFEVEDVISNAYIYICISYLF